MNNSAQLRKLYSGLKFMNDMGVRSESYKMKDKFTRSVELLDDYSGIPKNNSLIFKIIV